MARPPAPGPVVVNNGVEIKLHWGKLQGNFTNVLHGTSNFGINVPAGLAETLFTAFKAGFTSSAFATHVHPTMSFTGVSVKSLSQANQGDQLSTGVAVPGTGTGTALADSIAIVVTLATAQSGRGFRGRVYLGGLDTGAQADARHHTAQAGTDATTFINGIISSLGTNSIVAGVLQRALLADPTATHPPLNQPRTAGIIQITQARMVSSRLDSQRRRLGRE